MIQTAATPKPTSDPKHSLNPVLDENVGAAAPPTDDPPARCSSRRQVRLADPFAGRVNEAAAALKQIATQKKISLQQALLVEPQLRKLLDEIEDLMPCLPGA